MFSWECVAGSNNKWWIHKTALSEMLYELHVVIIMMSCFVATIVFYSIPYRYDRFQKTQKELDFDTQAREKKERQRKKREKKKNKTNATDLSFRCISAVHIPKKNTVSSQLTFICKFSPTKKEDPKNVQQHCDHLIESTDV